MTQQVWWSRDIIFLYSLVYSVHHVKLFECQYSGVNKTQKSKQNQEQLLQDTSYWPTLLFHNATCPLIKTTHSNNPLPAFSLFSLSVALRVRIKIQHKTHTMTM